MGFNFSPYRVKELTCLLTKVKGHSNNFFNDQADELANAGTHAYQRSYNYQPQIFPQYELRSL
jgi:hypothetical protein